MNKKFAIVHSAIFVEYTPSHYIKKTKKVDSFSIDARYGKQPPSEEDLDDVATQLSSQLHYSIKTLLDHKNDEIADIYLYSNKAEELKYVFEKAQKKNNIDLDLTKINFINFEWKTPTDQMNPTMCLHKWENVLNTFNLKNYESILWLDADTYINRNLEYLFDRFKDIDYVAAKLERLYFKKETRFFNTLDSGVMLFTNKVFKRINLTPEQFRIKLIEKIIDLSKQAKFIIDTNTQMYKWNIYNFCQWVVEQVAGQDVLRDLGIKCTNVLYDEGHMAAWPEQIGGMFHYTTGTCDIHKYPICHYKNYYGPIFIPKAFWHERQDGTSPVREIFNSSNLLATYGSDQIKCRKCGLSWSVINQKWKHKYLSDFPKPFEENIETISQNQQIINNSEFKNI